MYTLHPDLAITRHDGTLHIEDRDTRLTFDGESATACGRILEALTHEASIKAIARRSGYSARTAEHCVHLLAQEGYVLRQDFKASAIAARDAIAKVREAALFWNKHVMAQFFPVKLFAGEASKAEVLGWGIEFYHFVRAARDYMARGASRTFGDVRVLSHLWDHFSEEAFHDEIFLQGLIGCGLDQDNLVRRPPIASTMALLNHLWECSEEGDLEYAALFAVMQPMAEPRTGQDIKLQYDKLRGFYPFAAPLFDAFEGHDRIDVALEHSTLTIEPLLKMQKSISPYQMNKLLLRIRETAENFDLFFEGIPDYYRTISAVSYRQLPNANEILFGDLRSA